MSRTISSSAAAIGISLLLAACGGSSTSTTGKTAAAAPAASTTASSSSATTVKTASSALGTILVDAQGMTLYRLGGESAGRFICTSKACLAIWHPLTATAGATPSGAGSLGTVSRPDGSTQVTHEGAPLYTFASDAAPGQTHGQGLRDVGTWSVVKVSGGSSAAATGAGAPASEPAGTPGSGSSGGYAY